MTNEHGESRNPWAKVVMKYAFKAVFVKTADELERVVNEWLATVQPGTVQPSKFVIIPAYGGYLFYANYLTPRD